MPRTGYSTGCVFVAPEVIGPARSSSNATRTTSDRRAGGRLLLLAPAPAVSPQATPFDRRYTTSKGIPLPLAFRAARSPPFRLCVTPLDRSFSPQRENDDCRAPSPPPALLPRLSSSTDRPSSAATSPLQEGNLFITPRGIPSSEANLTPHQDLPVATDTRTLCLLNLCITYPQRNRGLVLLGFFPVQVVRTL